MIRRLARLARRLVLGAAALALLWALGFVWFAAHLPSEPADAAAPTDAVVVLTGGSQRLEDGIRLLADGKAKKLFISGVPPSIELAELLRVHHQDGSELACCIVLGHAADNTVGNAIETAAWVEREGFRSLRLVTSSYHMPRSLLEFSRAMPEATILPYPVFSESVHQERWWASHGTASLIAGEYDKYLWAVLRPLAFWTAEGRE